MSANTPSLATLAVLGPTRAAALWLERLQRDDVAAADEALFRQWVETSDANRDAWDSACDLWDIFEDADEAGFDLARMRKEARTLSPRRIAANSWWYGAAAASVAAIVLAVPLLSRLGGDGDHPPAGGTRPDQPGQLTYATNVGQRSTVALSDGTKVELDTSSAIKVDYSSGLRVVRLLRGQAFFDVAHNAAQPFRVAAGGRVVSDLGTSFDIRLLSGETRILLVQGSIAVSKGDDPRTAPTGEVETLTPGQQLTAHLGRPDVIAQADASRSSDWRQGVIQFDNTSLADAIAELNRYTTEQLVIRDPAVAKLRISGAFRTGDVKRFAETLTALYPVQLVDMGNGQIEIKRRH